MNVSFVPAMLFVVLVLVTPATPCLSAEYHVNVELGDDKNPGDPHKPLKSITKASTLAQPGDTVIIHPGVYHEQVDGGRSGESGRPITYKGVSADSVILRGAVRVTDWLPGGRLWHKMGLHPITPGNAFVMVDESRLLKRVNKLGEVVEGCFHLSDAGVYAIRLQKDADPNKDHVVDVYELDFAFQSGDRWGGTAKRHIVLRNLTLEKYGANGVSTDAEHAQANSHWELDTLTVRFNLAEGVFYCLDQWRVHDCRFVRNRGHGCQLNGKEITFEGNYCAQNEWFGPHEDAGCGILVGPTANAAQSVIRNNIFEANGAERGFGCGVYLEGQCRDNIIEKNTFIGGTAAGVAFFGSRFNVVRNNILIGAPDSARWDYPAAFVFGLSHEGPPTPPEGNLIANNTVVGTISPVSTEAALPTASAPNRMVNNVFVQCRFLATAPENIELAANVWYVCPAIPDGSVALARWLRRFRSQHDILLEAGELPGFVNEQARDFRLTERSSLVGRGLPLAKVTDDFLGRPRPVDKGTSIGAFEYSLKD